MGVLYVRKIFIFFIFFLLAFPLYAFPDGVFPIPSTRQEVEPGIFIIQATDGRWYQESIPEEDEDITYLSLTGKYDSIFEAMQKVDDLIGKPDDIKSYTPGSSSTGGSYRNNLDTSLFGDGGLFGIEPSGGYVSTRSGITRDNGEKVLVGWSVFTGVSNFKIVDNLQGIPSYTFNYTGGSQWRNDYVSVISLGPGSTGVALQMNNNWWVEVSTNVYVSPDNIPSGSGGRIYLEGYVGYGDPENGVTPEDDSANPDGENYIPEGEIPIVPPDLTNSGSLFGILGDILNAIKYNTAVVIQKTDVVISQLKQMKNNSILPNDNDINVNFDDIDFSSDVEDGDSWFVKLLKAIAKFFASLIVPKDVVTVVNGVPTKQNYFTYNFNLINDDFANKFGYEDYTSSLNSFVNIDVNVGGDEDDSNINNDNVVDSSMDSTFNGYINLKIWNNYLPDLQTYLRGFFYALLVIYNIKMVQVLIRTTSPIKTGKDN